MNTSTKKIVLLNGPPNSGKDTLASALVNKKNKFVTIEKFANPIKWAAKSFFNFDDKTFNYYENEGKDRPEFLFGGKSWRQVQISISEDWAKKCISRGVFGRLLAQRINESDKQLFLITDSGFLEEAEVLLNEFDRYDILLVRIIREGTSFDGDSRSYWNNSLGDFQESKVYNNGTIKEGVQSLKYCIERADRTF